MILNSLLENTDDTVAKQKWWNNTDVKKQLSRKKAEDFFFSILEVLEVAFSSWEMVCFPQGKIKWLLASAI